MGDLLKTKLFKMDSRRKPIRYVHLNWKRRQSQYEAVQKGPGRGRCAHRQTVDVLRQSTERVEGRPRRFGADRVHRFEKEQEHKPKGRGFQRRLSVAGPDRE